MAVTGPSLGRFFDELRNRLALVRSYDEQLNRLLAQRFNLIDFLQPDEYRVSQLVALLLDPVGPHGQGAAFLHQFLSRLSGVPAAQAFVSALAGSKRVRVRLEEPTRQGRRIDIIVSIDHLIGIGIENKPWAGAQLEQLDHYAKQLEEQYPTWLLVYVSGTGDPPPVESLGRERRKSLLAARTYIEWSYPVELANWLKECGQVCEADKVRWLIRDFYKYVISNFKLIDQRESEDGG